MSIKRSVLISILMGAYLPNLTAMLVNRPALHASVSPLDAYKNTSQATTSDISDLSYQEIYDLSIQDLQVDLDMARTNINRFHDQRTNWLCSNTLNAMAEYLQKAHSIAVDRDVLQAAYIQVRSALELLAPELQKINISGIDTIYKQLDKIQVKLRIHYMNKTRLVAALPIPQEGAWKEVHQLAKTICHANNMDIPKLYYGRSLATSSFIGQGIYDPATTYIVIESRSTKNSSVQELKAIVAHELGHLYYGDVSKCTLDDYLEAIADPNIRAQSTQKFSHMKEYRADVFAAQYGLGSDMLLHLFEKQLGQKSAQQFKARLRTALHLSPSAPSTPITSSHPSHIARIKNLEEADQEMPPQTIKVPHFWPPAVARQASPFNPARFTKYVMPEQLGISEEEFAQHPSIAWSARPYTGTTKKIDISAQPVNQDLAAETPVTREDLNFSRLVGTIARKKQALEALAKSANILKRLPK